MTRPERLRWTDEMVDHLASSVSELRESISEMRDDIFNLKESIFEMRDDIDGLRITAQALLQVAAQQQRADEDRKEEMREMKQRQAESDLRFNILLDEVRYLVRKSE